MLKAVINRLPRSGVEWGIIAALFLLALTVALHFSTPSRAAEIGSVDTAFKLFGANHKIVIEAFEDPEIPGVVCHLSRAVTGGFQGTIGIAEDPSEASIACRQIGPIALPSDLKARDGERVFSEKRSIAFKTLQVVRLYDAEHGVLVYLAYSDKLVDGSPKNAISTVPVMAWAPQP